MLRVVSLWLSLRCFALPCCTLALFCVRLVMVCLVLLAVDLLCCLLLYFALLCFVFQCITPFPRVNIVLRFPCFVLPCIASLGFPRSLAVLCFVLFRCVAFCFISLRFVSLRCIVCLVCRWPCFVFIWLCFIVFGLLCSSVRAFTLLCFSFLSLLRFVSLCFQNRSRQGSSGNWGHTKNASYWELLCVIVRKEPLLGKLIGIENAYNPSLFVWICLRKTLFAKFSAASVVS